MPHARTSDISNPEHEEFSRASDVVAHGRGCKMLMIERGVRRDQQFIIFLIARAIWAPSPVAAFYNVLCRAADRVPTATDALLLLGGMEWLKDEMWAAEENEITTWAPRPIANKLNLRKAHSDFTQNLGKLQVVADLITAPDSGIFTNRKTTFDKKVVNRLKAAGTGHGPYGAPQVTKLR